MIVTEPLDADTWAQIGWEGCETLDDAAHAYMYAQRTADGRIAIGGRGRPYRFGSSTDRAGAIPDATVRQLRARLVRLFPTLADVRVDGAWTGVFGVARDWAAAVHCDRDGGLCWAGGYAGEGVAAANLAARTLRDLILGRDTELARLPWVGHRARGWEPEPLRWLAVQTVYGAFRAADALEDRTGRPVAAGGGSGGLGRALIGCRPRGVGGASWREQRRRGNGVRGGRGAVVVLGGARLAAQSREEEVDVGLDRHPGDHADP